MPRSKVELDADLMMKLDAIASLNSRGQWVLKNSPCFQPNQNHRRDQLEILLLIQKHLEQKCSRKILCDALSRLPAQDQASNATIISLASDVIEWRALNADQRYRLEQKLQQELKKISKVDSEGYYAAPRKEKHRHTWEVLMTTLRYLTHENCYYEELFFTQMTLFSNYSRELSTGESTDALIKEVIDSVGIKELSYEYLSL